MPARSSILASVIREGFSLAHQRLRWFILDLFWKSVWLSGTAALIAVAGFWLLTELPGPELGGANVIMLAMAVGSIWRAYAQIVVLTLGGVAAAAIVFRIVLEAYFRGGARHFWVFAGTRLARNSILTALMSLLAVLVIWDRTAGVVFIAAIVLSGSWFLLTVMETLIRGDAIESFAAEPLLTIAAIGFFLAAELASAALAVVFSAAAILLSARSWELLTAITFAVSAGVVWSVVQSYLFVARCSTVDIMRRNVAGI